MKVVRLENLLAQKAHEFTFQAEAAKKAKDKFHAGFFEGKAEQCLLTILALKEKGSMADVLDVLNGDKE